MPDLGKTSSGLQPNLAALLAYVVGLVTGLVFILIEKENRFVRFHAMQSIFLHIAFVVCAIALGILPGIGPMLAMLLNLGGVALWVVCMVKAYQGEMFKLPVVGDFAEKQIGPSA